VARQLLTPAGMNHRPRSLLLAALAASCVGSTNEGLPPSPPGGGTMQPTTPGAPLPYAALPPRAYAAKVKDLLTGLPLQDDELAAVTADPQALRRLIDAWMEQPTFRAKMLDFFKKAFQQTQIVPADLDDQLKLASAGVSGAEQRLMVRSVEESFARTVLAMIDERRPFTETVTTNRFMLNVPLMMALGYMDAAPQDDLGRNLPAGSWLLAKYGGPKGFKFTMTTNTDPATGVATPIPFEQSIDPASPNFMKFTFTQPDPLKYKPCADPIVVMGANGLNAAFRALFGSRQGCQGAPAAPTLFSAEDWNSWRMVTIRLPANPTEERTAFWDLPRFRDPRTTELVLATPRIGFLTTLAFFANWPTNPSNSYRVTVNQALIVGLGKSFDDRNTTVQVSETSVDAQHAQPGTVCYGCHQVLDPMRDFYKQSYSLTYFQQLSTLDPKNPPLPAEGVFAVDNVTVRGNGVQGLARAMATHPRFAVAWTQRLCQLANASQCDEDDPELRRVAGVFAASNHDFKVLVRELLSSPLVTYAAPTKSAETNGVVLSIARRDNFCDRLGSRLAVKDLCNQQGESGLPKIAGQAKNLSLGIPGSAYARADERPVSPHDPNLFFVSATEKLCMAVAGQVVEGATARWKVATKDAAFSDFVTLLMGVPASDPLAPRLVDVLARNYATAVAAKEMPADALRSTFTLACASPLAVSSGL
jgi:hypothetical protein